MSLVVVSRTARGSVLCCVVVAVACVGVVVGRFRHRHVMKEEKEGMPAAEELRQSRRRVTDIPTSPEESEDDSTAKAAPVAVTEAAYDEETGRYEGDDGVRWCFLLLGCVVAVD